MLHGQLPDFRRLERLLKVVERFLLGVAKLETSTFRALEHDSFFFISQRGSHVKYRRTGSPTLTVIIPAGRKQVPRGTLRSILRQASLTEADLEK